MLTYPPKYTDVEWKKTEKTIKIEATGIGKTLRDMEKTAKALDEGWVALAAKKTDAAKVKAALKAHEDTTAKAFAQIQEVMFKQKGPTPAQKYLQDLRLSMSRYQGELKKLKLDGGQDPRVAAKNFNQRVAALK